MDKFKQHSVCHFYYRARLINLLPSFALMIIGSVILTSNTNYYGDILKNETLEWSLPPVIDFLYVPLNQNQSRLLAFDDAYDIQFDTSTYDSSATQINSNQ